VDNKFSFEDLNVFQESLLFVDHVYRTTDNFPKEEVYGLITQFKRAAVSISLNIGEGSGATNKEFINFLRISRRSVNECLVCAIISRRQNYITSGEELELRKQLTKLSKMISGLMSAIKEKDSLITNTKYQIPNTI
jgi:four helix bundle protein